MAGQAGKNAVSSDTAGEHATAAVQLDLPGVRCPLSWAKAKVRLEALAAGQELTLLVDDAKGARDIPRAAEAVGYAVAEPEYSDGTWRISIQA